MQIYQQFSFNLKEFADVGISQIYIGWHLLLIEKKPFCSKILIKSFRAVALMIICGMDN
jgi:hypothetical protein